ncbi:MAG: hypothetical protein H0V65_03705, partial [Chitinophagales bacterium]|nr:hypothetical protein [Chitinophagales bacterium]
MKKIFCNAFFLIIFNIGASLIAYKSYSQTLRFVNHWKLPKLLHEVSGIEYEEGKIFFINDSGGRNSIYYADAQQLTKGRRLTLKHIVDSALTNHDWEDLASGEDGELYVGDFGNNANSRHNLAIYITEMDSSSSSKNLIPSVLTFRYPDQKEFPPPPSNWNYDCEAFLYYHDS